MSLVLKNVSKTFVGKVAVDNISFSIEKPGVYGLLGTNGAGKTTTIRMLLGIIKKDSGEITWKGKEVDRENVNFGYLPEERGVYPKTKIMDQLMYFAELKGMKKDDAITAINKWAKELKVEEYLQMPAEKLSKGNQQKIQFMNAIIHNPELVVLDEPFSGLDPVNTEILKNIIIDLVKNGKYVIMSAHQMATIEEFCSDILILNKGKTVLQGNLKQIKETYPANRVEIDVKQDIDTYIKEFNLEIENVANYNYVIKINELGFEAVYNHGAMTYTDLGKKFKENLGKKDMPITVSYFFTDLIINTKNIIRPYLANNNTIVLQDRYFDAITTYIKAYGDYIKSDYNIYDIPKAFVENDILVKPSLSVFCIPPFEIIKERMDQSKESPVHDFYRDNPEFFKIVYNELVSKANESKENIIIDTSSDLSVEQGINKILEFIKK